MFPIKLTKNSEDKTNEHCFLRFFVGLYRGLPPVVQDQSVRRDWDFARENAKIPAEWME